MPEQIKVLSRTAPAIIIWNLMCAHTKNAADMLKIFPGLETNGHDTVVQAELIVNGVSLPVMDALQTYWEKAEAELDQRARDMAAEILKGSRLQSIMDRMSAIEWDIHEELDKLFPNTKREDY